MRVHAIDPRSRANGPGVRFVVWFQGCTLGCPGCFNPATHVDAGPERAIEDIVRELAASVGNGAKVDGLTLSGGEPMQQAEAAQGLLIAAREPRLSTLMFSGYTLDEIRGLPGGRGVLANLDVLVDGRYVAAERLGKCLRGSTNQTIHLLTDRHTLAEVEATPVAEVVIRGGEVALTGVNPLKLKR